MSPKKKKKEKIIIRKSMNKLIENKKSEFLDLKDPSTAQTPLPPPPPLPPRRLKSGRQKWHHNQETNGRGKTEEEVREKE